MTEDLKSLRKRTLEVAKVLEESELSNAAQAIRSLDDTVLNRILELNKEADPELVAWFDKLGYEEVSKIDEPTGYEFSYNVQMWAMCELSPDDDDEDEDEDAFEIFIEWFCELAPDFYKSELASSLKDLSEEKS